MATQSVLSRDDLVWAIDRIRDELKARGVIGTIKIIGGTAMILSDLADRESTVDIDAVVITPADTITQISADIARERAWPGDWINLQAQGLYPAYAGHPLWVESLPLSDETLSIHLATQEALLAMKLNASRRRRDEGDIQALMTACDVTTVAAVDEHFSEYFRGESMPDKAVVLLRKLGYPDGDTAMYAHIPKSRPLHAAHRPTERASRGAPARRGRERPVNSAACT